MIDIDKLVERAEASESEEFIVPVEKNSTYTIAVGVRMLHRRRNKFQIFTAVSIKLGIRENCSIDLDQLIRAATELFMFRHSGYCMCYGGDGTVYVEREIRRENVEQHLNEIRQMLSSACQEQ
jgi:hypothetical protein